MHPSVVVAALLVALAVRTPNASGQDAWATATENRVVEIRTYNLKPGSRAEFHRLATERAIPMLRRWKIDVVAHGPSPQDTTSYYLIRAFASLADRQQSEDAFYGSDEWITGPRAAILALIENYTTAVLELDTRTVAGLRRR